MALNFVVGAAKGNVVSALKNVTRVQMVKYGKPTWLLLDNTGTSIPAFSYYCEKNLDYAFATQKRYAEVVAQFIDYLIEAEVFGVAISKRQLNAVIDAYPLFLRDGSSTLRIRLQESINQNPEDMWLLKVTQSLERLPLKPSSFSNTLAAINRFLRLSEALAVEAFERASLAGIDHKENYRDLIVALSGNRSLSEFEVKSMRQNSVLGSVMRFRGEGLTRPRSLAVFQGHAQDDTHHLDFPFDFVVLLSESATSKRDKALWLLLAASGIRVSEALNLQWSDIDVTSREVYVYDPRGRRLGGDLTHKERIRFKGRVVSMTYLIQPFRRMFFEALEQYVREEYVPPRDKSHGDFVFQYVELGRRGTPYVTVSHTSMNKNFQAACARADVPTSPNSEQWTIHSLRHLYGVYMANDFPVDVAAGRYGLELAEVQVLMGHKSITSTRHYARQKRRGIERKLMLADKHLLGFTEEEILAIPRDANAK